MLSHLGLGNQRRMCCRQTSMVSRPHHHAFPLLITGSNRGSTRPCLGTQQSITCLTNMPPRQQSTQTAHQLTDIFTQLTSCTPPHTQEPSQPAPTVTTLTVALHATPRVPAPYNTQQRMMSQYDTPPHL
jgi:hypothetical protein